MFTKSFSVVDVFWGTSLGQTPDRARSGVLDKQSETIATIRVGNPFWRGLKWGVFGLVLAATLVGPARFVHAGALLSKTSDGPKTEQAHQEVLESSPGNSSAPIFDPSLWTREYLAALPENPISANDEQPRCYQYAVNAPAFSFPGASAEVSLRPRDGNRYVNIKDEFTKRVRAVIAGATLDGLRFIGSKPRNEAGKYLIAYYEAPPAEDCDDGGSCNADYHFVRQDSDGSWSHKPGTYKPTKLDSDGKPITDPANANIRLDGRPYKFIGYFLAPEGGLSIYGTPPPQGWIGIDRLRRLESPKARLHDGEGLVAFFSDERNWECSFFLQKDDEGRWCQYISEITPPSYVDNDGNPVIDPAKANFGKRKFVAYYAAPNGSVFKELTEASRPGPNQSLGFPAAKK